MDELPKLDRTWLCSVVFVDIVEYSVQSVALQMSWKDRLNRYLAVGIQDVPDADRVILDTGDGAAICFLGDPEAAMFCGLRLLGSLIEEEPKHEPCMRARVGINLGPVKLVRDINGNLNAIGDGINVGQRVMSFARDNQVLVSRSFYEVVSCLSDNYVHLFRYEGVRRDKHVREHTVYELLPPGARHHAEADAPGAAGAEEAAASPLVTAVRERIEGCFAPIVGPMAHYLVLQASSHASSPLEVCQALLDYVPAPEDQERFLRAWDAEFKSELDEYYPAPAATHPANGAGTPAPEPRRTPPQTPAASFEPSLLERVRRELALYIGPLARLMVERASARARTETELYDLLAAQIESPGDRDKFRRAGHRSHVR
jgi:class 3 adenylate cyclase